MSWIPTNLPEPTKEYNNLQSSKRYLVDEEIEKKHPGWKYDNGALVCDEYLFKNNGWQLIVDNYPTDSSGKIVVRNPSNLWINSSENNTVEVTYKIYTILDDESVDSDNLKTKTLKNQLDWSYNEEDLTVTKTYEITYYTDEELNQKKLFDLRTARNIILGRTDYMITLGYEKNKTISQKMKDYRQGLRDITETIDLSKVTFSDIRSEKCFPAHPPLEEIYDA
jgi:hypothetical protein